MTKPEICISVETPTEVLDHAHYCDDKGRCCMNLHTMRRHLLKHFDDTDPQASLYENYCEIADTTRNATLRIRVNHCPYETNWEVTNG